MKTLEEIAQYIESQQLDLTEFNTTLSKDEDKALILINKTKDICIKALKTELYLLFMETHPQRYSYSSKYESLIESLIAYLRVCINSPHLVATDTLWRIARKYDISYTKQLDTSTHITAHLTNVKQYLPKYLWNKIRDDSINRPKLKKLSPDLFSLNIFKSYLNGIKKGITSADALRYFNEIRGFELTIRYQFVEVILDNCPKQSIELQKNKLDIIPYVSSRVNPTKYMFLYKGLISDLARKYNLLVSATIFDDRYSDYKPFVTGVNRVPTPDNQQMTYLVNALLILQYANKQKPNPSYKQVINELTEHLKDPAYAEVLPKYLNELSNFNRIIKTTEQLFEEQPHDESI